MGFLLKGKWQSDSRFNTTKAGSFDRPKSIFRHTISDEDSIFKPEKDRYHLYVSYACPWAHRTLIIRQFKQLEDWIRVSVVHPDMLENGWEFRTDFPGAKGDLLYDSEYLHQIYTRSDTNVSCRVTVPILWDSATQKIVNNESSDIIRIFNYAFNKLTGNEMDFYPSQWQAEIDAINTIIYDSINNGVYKAGFAQSQEAYDQAIVALFEQLDLLDQHFSDHQYLVGEQLTEADIRLIPTLIRFDAVYHTHFKCNTKQIRDYSNLYRYVKRLSKLDPIGKTTEFNHIIRHYYYSHILINPYQIIPTGPRPLL